MPSKLIGLSLVTGLMSATAFAEPPIQSGDSLESLSKVVITTTVNGQSGSIQDLVSRGQIQIVDTNPASAQGESTQVDAEATAQPQVTNAAALQTSTEQSTTTQPHTKLAMAQQQVLDQESDAASAPTMSSNENAVAPDIASSAEAPVNTELSSQADVAIAPMAQSNNK